MPAASASTPRLKVLFFTLLSACTVAALQTVGACLVIAMVVTPGATAYLLTDRFGRLIVDQRRDRRRDQLRRRLSQLFPRRRDRRRDRRRCRRWCSSPRSSSRPSTACSPRAAGAAPRTGGTLDDASLDSITRAAAATLHAARARSSRCWSAPSARCCPAILVLKGWSLMGDAISHAVLPGIVIAYMLGLPLALGAFAAGLACALLPATSRRTAA